MSASGKSVFWLTVAGTVAGTWAAAALGWLGGIGTWLSGVVGAIWRHLGAASFPNWVVYVLLLIAAQSLIHWAFRFNASSKDNFRRYTRDSFFGAEWRWGYISNTPHQVWAFCQRCGTQLVYNEQLRQYGGGWKTTLSCENCGTTNVNEQGDKEYLVGKVTRQIFRKLESGEWRAAADAMDARRSGN